MGSAPDEGSANAELAADEDSATDAEPAADTKPAVDEGAAGAESAADEDSAAGAEPAADTESEVNAESAADEDTASAEPAADEDITDTAAPASAPAPQDPAAPAVPVPTSPGSPPPSTGARPTPATPIPAITAAMGPVPAPPAAPVPPPPAAASMGPVPAPVPTGSVPAATAPAGPVPTGSLPITPFPTGPAPTNPLPVTPFPTGPVPVSSASTGSIPVVPAHVGPAPAGAGPASPVPAPPTAPVPPPPAVTASPRTLQAAAPAGDAPQWSRGQWWTVLVLGVLAAIMEVAVLVLQYLDLMGYAGEEWWLFTNMTLVLLHSPLVLTVVGIVQTCRKAAPSAFVAAAALIPAFIFDSFSYFQYSSDYFRYGYFIIAGIVHIAAMVITLIIACMCLWGRLPHHAHTPRSAIALSALGMALMWRTALDWQTVMITIDGRLAEHYYEDHTDPTVINIFTISIIVCCAVMLALMTFHKNVIVARLSVTFLGMLTLTEIVLTRHYYLIVSWETGIIIPAALLLLGVPVFCASFRQWCAGTWTAPAWKPSAVAGRPTILARTSQVTDPDGNTLNDAEIAAMLPTTRPTFWVSLFFGLFGLLPMLTANSTARSLGVVTNAYNSAMIKGFVLGILMWTAITAASYTIILFGLL